ncbi:hypothetical protein D3C80_1961780 [compost metagenome]
MASPMNSIWDINSNATHPQRNGRMPVQASREGATGAPACPAFALSAALPPAMRRP